MTMVRAALIAPLFLLPGAVAQAQDVSLSSRDGGVEVSGTLLGYDGEFYRVSTEYGELTVDGSGVNCAGPGCPNLDQFVARLAFSGSPTIGRVLMPGLLEAFALKNDYMLERRNISERAFVYTIAQKSGDLIGEFTFRLSNSDEGFADLLANEADIVMSLREVQPDEAKRAKELGLGDLMARGRSRVLALDALVPLVAPANPVQALTAGQLSRVLSGEIDNWAPLGGPDAPIDVHLLSASSGLGQATEQRLLAPEGRSLVDGATRHDSDQALIAAVAQAPFALGVSSRSDIGDTRTLALRGECGFALAATHRTVKTEDYPLTAPLFLYMPARRFPQLGRDFLTYLRDPSAQLVIRRAGFVDQTPEEIGINAQGDRFANAIARAGADTSLGELQAMVRKLAPLKRLSTTFRFEEGATRLDAQSRSNVLQLARQIELGQFDARRLVFVGFSDGQGRAESNLEIARERAETVRAAVLRAAENADVTHLRIETTAFGEAMPMACDDTEWGRRTNRRVEVWVR